MPDEELFISYGVGRMWWEEGIRNGRGHSTGEIDEESDERVEDELLMLGQLGLDHDEKDSRQPKRREDRRRNPHSSSRLTFTPTPPTSTPPLITPPKSIGPEAAPLWRITAAVDPNTTPLELMTVWAVEIDPRKSSNFMQFSRSISRRLRAAEGGGDGEEHIRREQEQRRQDDDDDEDMEEEDDDEADDSEDEDQSMKHLRLFHRTSEGHCLSALVCRVQDVPLMDKVMALLKSADVVLDGTEPRPYQVQVPKYPAPSRDRLPEWKSFWPVAVKHGKTTETHTSSNLLSNGHAMNQGSLTPGAVDRAADARLWTKEATQWAINNFRRCIALAKQAKEQGELPVGVHVTPSFTDSEASNSIGPDGHSWIAVDAWDTRRSERNPIKHGVTNAIKDVAKIRSDRDRERLVALGAKVAAQSRDALADPVAFRQAVKAVDDASQVSNSNTSSRAISNSGQDYLLNNLILFTTHEPCLLCCMSLVHSRVRAIYFIQPSPGAGGCCGSGLQEELRCTYAQDGGPYAVQEQAGLNHHFDVWKWVGGEEELGENNLDQLLDIENLDA